MMMMLDDDEISVSLVEETRACLFTSYNSIVRLKLLLLRQVTYGNANQHSPSCCRCYLKGLKGKDRLIIVMKFCHIALSCDDCSLKFKAILN